MAMVEPISNPAAQRWFVQFPSALGLLGLAWSEAGLTRMQLPEIDDQEGRRRLQRDAEEAPAGSVPPFVRTAMDLLRAYAEGARTQFADLPLDLTDRADFDQAVYRRTVLIGYGRTATYGDIAHDIAGIGAARAVGQALGRNPLAIIVPCHRILASGGKPGGFSAFGGRVTKARLLELEGIVLPGFEPTLPGLDLPQRSERS